MEPIELPTGGVSFSYGGAAVCLEMNSSRVEVLRVDDSVTILRRLVGIAAAQTFIPADYGMSTP